MDEFPQLSSENYTLRNFKATDLDEVFRALSHPGVIQHYGVSYKTKQATKEQMSWFERIFAEGSGFWWALEHKAKPGVLIGACGVNSWSHTHNKAEMGYWLLPEYWGQGVMHECVPTIIDHLFAKTRLHRIEANVEAENESSKKLLLRNGFSHEGTFKDSEWKNGRYITIEYYARLKT
jgi:ribosomal-protein-alanine N-acetyltransferase